MKSAFWLSKGISKGHLKGCSWMLFGVSARECLARGATCATLTQVPGMVNKYRSEVCKNHAEFWFANIVFGIGNWSGRGEVRKDNVELWLVDVRLGRTRCCYGVEVWEIQGDVNTPLIHSQNIQNRMSIILEEKTGKREAVAALDSMAQPFYSLRMHLYSQPVANTVPPGTTKYP